jgi:hypothetical protein
MPDLRDMLSQGTNGLEWMLGLFGAGCRGVKEHFGMCCLNYAYLF